MEKHSLVRILLAVGSAAALSSAPAVAQASVTLPSGRLVPSVFNEWTQFFDAGTSVAPARVRLLHSIQGSNRGQVNKWLNQWLRGLLDDDQFADDSDEDGGSGKKHPGVSSGQPKTGEGSSVSISGSSFDIIPPGADKAFVMEWPGPDEGSDQPQAGGFDPVVTVNPEPATFLLLAPGFAMAGLLVRRRRRHSVDD
jgi:hypothetical protein